MSNKGRHMYRLIGKMTAQANKRSALIFVDCQRA
jgi:hypothetical protein